MRLDTRAHWGAILHRNKPKGETMRKQKYLTALIQLLTVDEIKQSAQNPSTYMTPLHVKLHYVALRRLGHL
jgi:hypothetical protein